MGALSIGSSTQAHFGLSSGWASADFSATPPLGLQYVAPLGIVTIFESRPSALLVGCYISERAPTTTMTRNIILGYFWQVLYASNQAFVPGLGAPAEIWRPLGSLEEIVVFVARVSNRNRQPDDHGLFPIKLPSLCDDTCLVEGCSAYFRTLELLSSSSSIHHASHQLRCLLLPSSESKGGIGLCGCVSRIVGSPEAVPLTLRIQIAQEILCSGLGTPRMTKRDRLRFPMSSGYSVQRRTPAVLDVFSPKLISSHFLWAPFLLVTTRRVLGAATALMRMHFTLGMHSSPRFAA